MARKNGGFTDAAVNDSAVDVEISPGDAQESDIVCLTVSGTSAECGDDSETGGTIKPLPGDAQMRRTTVGRTITKPNRRMRGRKDASSRFVPPLHGTRGQGVSG